MLIRWLKITSGIPQYLLILNQQKHEKENRKNNSFTRNER